MKETGKRNNAHPVFWTIVKVQMIFLLLVLVALLFYFFGGYAAKVQSAEEEAVQLVANCNEYRDSTYLEYEQIPALIRKTVVCTTDKNFYQDKVSRLDQKLAQIISLDNGNMIERMVRKRSVAMELERQYSKDKILEIYINNLNFANGYMGIQSAARGYFNCEVAELNSAKIAFLLSIPQNPQDFDPLTNMDRVLEEKQKLLKQMQKSGVITSEDYLAASKLEIVLTRADTEPPVIHASDTMTTVIGKSLNYKGSVIVTDNVDTEVELTVDSSQVNLSVEGSYPVTYTARDTAGNEATKVITVIVGKPICDQTEIDHLADQILREILTESMTPREKLTAIYNWVQSNITYVNYSEKTNWREAAYEGFVLHKGDCYVFASTSKALLTRAGIANIDISKIPTETTHYWNLVDIGEGWHHFDTTPRVDKADFCYVDDQTLMAYSDAHNKSHEYDRSVYTEIK